MCVGGTKIHTYTSDTWIVHQVGTDSKYQHYQPIDFSLKPTINMRTKNKRKFPFFLHFKAGHEVQRLTF